MAGKIAGIGLLGIVQLVAIATFAIGLARATGALEIPSTAIGVALIVLVWFVMGFAFYAGLFAVSGSLVSRTEELQNALVPINLIIFVSFFMSLEALQDPDAPVPVLASILPFSSALAMPVRIAMGSATVPQIVLGRALVGGTALLVPLPARLYSGAVLKTGTRVKILAWRSAPATGPRADPRPWRPPVDTREPAPRPPRGSGKEESSPPRSTTASARRLPRGACARLAEPGLWEEDGSDPDEAPGRRRRLVEATAHELPTGGDVLDAGNGLGEQDPVIAEVAGTRSLTAVNITVSQLLAGKPRLTEAGARGVNARHLAAVPRRIVRRRDQRRGRLPLPLAGAVPRRGARVRGRAGS